MWGWLGAVALAQSPSPADPIDVNVATVDQLDALPGLGPAKAQGIVDWVRRSGPCQQLEQLSAVPGLGQATLAALSGRMHCGGDRPPGAVADPPPRVDLDTASVEQLMALPGITAPRAEAILGDRSRNGGFPTCADLQRVPGIGPATVAHVTPHCTCSPR